MREQHTECCYISMHSLSKIISRYVIVYIILRTSFKPSYFDERKISSIKWSMAFDYVTVDNLKTSGLSGPSRPTNVLGQLSSSDSNGIHNDKLAQKISPSLALPQNLWVSKKKEKKKGP